MAPLHMEKSEVKALVSFVRLVDPPFHRRELIENSGGIRPLKIFRKSSAINKFCLPLPSTV